MKLIVETRIPRLIYCIKDIEQGLLQIPPFQRDKVWDNNKRKDLFDSLKNGYPIGAILLWKPDKNVVFEESLNKVGPYTVNIENIENFFYILDGFQRLSTIFGCLIDPNKSVLPRNQDEWKKEFYLCYDLKEEEFFIPRATSKLEIHQIPVYELIDTKASYKRERDFFKHEYPEEDIEIYMERYRALGSTLIDYTLPCTEIKGGEIEDAVDIFSRINSKGSIISQDWMVSALSYNKDKQSFKLSSLIDELVNELKTYNFDTLKRDIFLQCIAHSFGKAHFDQLVKRDTSKIEKLVKRNDFVEITIKVIESIKKAIRFLFEELLVVDGKLLPTNNHLIFVTDFFNQIENPSEVQLEKLKQWFWITTYSNYFTMYSLSKQREAYNQFQKFIKDVNENPVYNDNPNLAFSAPEFPHKITLKSVRAKALLLFMLNYTNKFEKINQADINGFKLNYLFYDAKDDNNNFYPEGAVAILDEMQNKFPKSKDMSFMLDNLDENYENYFITSNMKDTFRSKSANYQNEILKKRKDLIIDAEKIFVEKLGIKYDIQDYVFLVEVNNSIF